MSDVAKPRIMRKHNPPPLTKSRHRRGEIRRCLQADFAQRCAYCMCHEQVLGHGHFDIEHFCPEVAGGSNGYDNLYWSCKTCNSHKGEHWPLEEEHQNGRRFADPCREQDYGLHLVEDADGTLHALTDCGHYHLSKLFLNRQDLVRRRYERTELRGLIAELDREIRRLRSNGTSAGSLAAFGRSIQEHRRQLAIAIPPIPGRTFGHRADRPATARRSSGKAERDKTSGRRPATSRGAGLAKTPPA